MSGTTAVPSGAEVRCSGSVNDCTHEKETMSHTRKTPLTSPDTIRLAETTTAMTGCWWPESAVSFSSSSGFHTYTMRSWPADSSSRRSATNESDVTPRVCASSGAPTVRPVATFQSRTVWSIDADAMSSKSGINSRHEILSVCPCCTACIGLAGHTATSQL
eukprot:402862-Prymnesium_polylepis.3